MADKESKQAVVAALADLKLMLDSLQSMIILVDPMFKASIDLDERDSEVSESPDPKTKKKSRENQLKCSFCGKCEEDVNKLIAGPGVYICDECVDLCNEILDEELSQGKGVERESSSKSNAEGLLPPAQQMLSALETLAKELSSIESRLEKLES